MNYETIKDADLEIGLNHLRQFVGNTPLWAVTGLHNNPKVKISAKLEWNQLGSSVKARAAYFIISDAIQSGLLDGSKCLLDATSGNTGIAYAQICAFLGLELSIVLPENASQERKEILSILGAELIYSSKFGTTDEAQDKALELSNQQPRRFYYADQYANENNWKAHKETTAKEIIRQTHGEVTHFITGLGTTGTYIGTTIGLKSHDEKIQCIGLQPESALHGLEGWKHLETAKVPAIYRNEIGDGLRTVYSQDAYDLIERAARTQGLLLSPSSAANLVGAIRLADEIDEGHIVTVFPDDAHKYMDVFKQVINSEK